MLHIHHRSAISSRSTTTTTGYSVDDGFFVAVRVVSGASHNIIVFICSIVPLFFGRVVNGRLDHVHQGSARGRR